MTIITHDIVPGGGLCIILKEPNTQRVLPDVSLRQYRFNMPDYQPDHDRLDAPPMVSPLPYFRIQGKEFINLRTSETDLRTQTKNPSKSAFAFLLSI